LPERWGLTGSRLAAIVVAVGFAASVAWLFWRRPILPYGQGAISSTLKVISGLATLAALFQLARLSVFIINPMATGYAIGPLRGPGLIIEHSCVSAYFAAARSVSTVPDIYSNDLYSSPYEGPEALRRPKRIGSFNIDPYQYPPPFLLLPRAVAILAPDFLRFRMLWFAINGTVLLIGLLAIARFIGPIAATRALMLSPLVFASDINIATLQIGNLQAMVFALAMLGMMFLAQRRYAAGGVLLAYTMLSKLFPGLLLIYLLARRQWRALAWTVGLSAVLVLASLLDTGRAPYHAFLDQFPKLMGGQAFPAFRNPVSMAKNYSVPGMVFKLRLFGLPGASFAAIKIVGSIYMLFAMAATVVLATRTLRRDQQPQIWLAILILASLRSPFLPAYAVLPALWLLTLLAATVVPTPKRLCVVLPAWAMLNAFIPTLHPDPRLISIVALLPQTVIAILVVLAFRNWAEPRNSQVAVSDDSSLLKIPDESRA
jgi:alpha-1,2-mannosyltransferase